MKQNFGTLPTGENCSLYTISCGALTARISDLGATLVQLWVPDRDGQTEDIVLGYDNAEGYLASNAYLGATVGRNANRIANSCFILDGKTWALQANQPPHNLHSGPDGFDRRLWAVTQHQPHQITLALESPHGDQGFPGNAKFRVTYTLSQDALTIRYEGLCDRDTLMNLTNHSYFNLAGHQNPALAMHQVLTLPARFFLPADATSIPTGELRPVAGTPMDFRTPKALDAEISADYLPLHLQQGYDHTFEVFCAPCAILQDPVSGRGMAVYTDRPGLQLYTANYTDTLGKNGVHYGKRSGVCLETQFYPDAVNHPQWPQPIVKAGTQYLSETSFRFFVSAP